MEKLNINIPGEVVISVLALAAGLGLGGWGVYAFQKRRARTAALGTVSSDSSFTFKSVTTFVVFALGLVIMAGCVAWYFGKEQPGDEFQMGVLVVAAIVTLMTVLFVLAAGFNAMELTEKGQPLGLPEGSIRAMIALILIMVFIIFGIYLFRIVGLNGAFTVEKMNTEPTAVMLARYQTLSGKTPLVESNNIVENVDGKTVTNKVFSVWVWTPTSDDGKRLAQQLVTTVGTLVVAVAGFYFGSSTLNASRNQTPPSPTSPLNQSVPPPTNPSSSQKPEELIEKESTTTEKKTT